MQATDRIYLVITALFCFTSLNSFVDESIIKVLVSFLLSVISQLLSGEPSDGVLAQGTGLGRQQH